MNLKEQYDAAFAKERGIVYPMVDDLEKSTGYAVERDRLEAAARVLACPLKVNPPNWQHGRVIYSLLRQRLARDPDVSGVVVDIGTAKGFSAVVMGWAIEDAGSLLEVVSVDAVDPDQRVTRNSVAEVYGVFTVHEFVAPFIAKNVKTTFVGGGSEDFMLGFSMRKIRIPLAFVDGKHSQSVVLFDANAIEKHQLSKDVIVFDDVQIAGVAAGISMFGAARNYESTRVKVSNIREYSILVRK
jgi:hypothetical protein